MDSNLQVLQKIKEYGVTYVNDDNYLNSVNYLLDYFRDLSDYLVDNQELQGILEDMEKTLNRILNG
jgi:CHASE3 domain sensor protein